MGSCLPPCLHHRSRNRSMCQSVPDAGPMASKTLAPREMTQTENGGGVGAGLGNGPYGWPRRGRHRGECEVWRLPLLLLFPFPPSNLRGSPLADSTICINMPAYAPICLHIWAF